MLWFCTAKDAGAGLKVAQEVPCFTDHAQALEVRFVLLAQQRKPGQKLTHFTSALLIGAVACFQAATAPHERGAGGNELTGANRGVVQ